MKIGHIIIEYYAELLIPKEKFSILNQSNVKWFPVLDIQKANAGWVWFSNYKEYNKAKMVIKK